VDYTYPINKMIKLIKKAIEPLDAVTSVPYSREGLGYTIGCGLDAILSFTLAGSPATLTREEN
jgi:hypothetical protein